MRRWVSWATENDLIRDRVKRKYNREGDPDDHGRCPDCIAEGKDRLIPLATLEIDHIGGQKTMMWSQSGTDPGHRGVKSYRLHPPWQTRREAEVSEPVCHDHHRERTRRGNWKHRRVGNPGTTASDPGPVQLCFDDFA